MLKSLSMYSFLIAVTLTATPSFAEDVTQREATNPAGKLDSISPSPASGSEEDCPMHKRHKEQCDHKKSNQSKGQHDDCPMHKNKQKKCEHKSGEPCPYHKDVEKHRD